jgi:DNA-binding LytR/AlgR family response regulator
MIRCAIIDDEPLAREVLESYVSDTPGLQLIGSCGSALQALELIRTEKPDVLFLDIRMPKLNGIDLLKTLTSRPLVVFTTAYAEYAVEGFNLEAVDYLLKPISFERFLKAVHRLEKLVHHTPERILLRADKKTWSVPFEDIICVEAQGDYMVFYCSEKKILVNERMKVYEELLPSGQFLRVHKSWMVNKQKVDYVEGNMIKLSGGKEVPIGKTYRIEVVAKLIA